MASKPPLLKSQSGIPSPLPRPAHLDLAAEARLARTRFYPVTAAYTAFAVFVIAHAVRANARVALIAAAWGVFAWTLTEYLVHRFVLHGAFPRREGRLGRWLHERFDRMHADHHQRPWDGMHVNGRFETAPFAAGLAVLSFLGPLPAAPAFVAAILQCYVIEEWVHYAVHFHQGGGPYLRYIRRHHLYHHGVRGKDEAFGLTSHVWDVPFGTDVGSSAARGLDGTASPPRAA